MVENRLVSQSQNWGEGRGSKHTVHVEPGIVAHTYRPTMWESETGGCIKGRLVLKTPKFLFQYPKYK